MDHEPSRGSLPPPTPPDIARTTERLLDPDGRAARALRREEQAAALAELARGAGAVAHLAEAFHLAVRLATRATSSCGSVAWRADETGAPRLEVTHGPVARRERAAQALLPLAAEAMAKLAPLVLDRVTDDPRLSAEDAASLSVIAVVPCVMQGHALGALAVYDAVPSSPGAAPGYDAGDVQFLSTLAAILGATAAQAEQHAMVRSGELRLHELRARLAREERLASLGEDALRVAREARNPLASIAAFARRVQRALPEERSRSASRWRSWCARSAGSSAMLAETLARRPPSARASPWRALNQSVQEALQAARRDAGAPPRAAAQEARPRPAGTAARRRARPSRGREHRRLRARFGPGGRARAGGVAAGRAPTCRSRSPRRPARPAGDLLEQLFVPFADRAALGGAAVGSGWRSRSCASTAARSACAARASGANVVSRSRCRSPGNEDRRRRRDRRRRGAADRRPRPAREAHAAGAAV